MKMHLLLGTPFSFRSGDFLAASILVFPSRRERPAFVIPAKRRGGGIPGDDDGRWWWPSRYAQRTHIYYYIADAQTDTHTHAERSRHFSLSLTQINGAQLDEIISIRKQPNELISHKVWAPKKLHFTVTLTWWLKMGNTQGTLTTAQKLKMADMIIIFCRVFYVAHRFLEEEKNHLTFSRVREWGKGITVGWSSRPISLIIRLL